MTVDGERGATGRDRWDEALTWYVRLREADEGEFSTAVGREWQDWYADAENQRVFEDVTRLLADRARYRERDRPGKAVLGGDRYDPSVPIAEWRKSRAPRQIPRRRSSARRRWWWLSGGLGAAAMIVLLELSPLSFGPRSSAAGAAIYQTAIDGIQHVHLRDGSSIVLGGQTELSVRLSPRQRSVRLIEGEAWFTVAHDRKWPFVVAAGDGTITAVGTAFLVNRESDRVVVTVTDGTVEVSAWRPVWSPLGLIQRLRMRPFPPPVPVSRGQELVFSDKGALQPVKPADTRAATAWMRGRLTFDDQPLRYVVETVDRYSSRHVVVSPSAGALRLSAVIYTNEIEDWLRSLENILPVTVRQRGGEVRIEMRHPSRATAQPGSHQGPAPVS